MKIKFFLALICGVSLAADETATVNRNRVNVRGGPSFASEVVTQLQKGDKVTFVEEIPVEKPKPGEPAHWARIKLPANTPVWIFGDYIDGGKVNATKLNVRAGPGENFSVLGTVVKGDSVKEIRRSEGWVEIEAPDSARAYLDASYLDRAEKAPTVADVLKEEPKVFEPSQPAANPVASKPGPAKPEAPKESKPAEAPREVAKAEPEKKETTPPALKEETQPTVVKEEPAPVVAKEETKPPATAPKPEEKTAPPVATAPQPAPTQPAAPVEKPAEVTRVLPQIAPPPATEGATNIVISRRVVRREGEVQSTRFNIQAPTYFELRSVDTGKVINYLHAEKSGIKLKDYKGLRVIVTGEEGIEPRFPERPVLEVETIEVAP